MDRGESPWKQVRLWPSVVAAGNPTAVHAEASNTVRTARAVKLHPLWLSDQLQSLRMCFG